MNRIILKRAMLAVLLTALLLSSTGCFIKPDPLADFQGFDEGSEIPLPLITEPPALPSPTETGDFSAWATNAPPSTVSQSSEPTSTIVPTDAPQNQSLETMPATSGAIASTEILTEGAKGLPVRDLQLRLQALGYYTGTVDGAFGAATSAALREFQKANGLSDDAIAGPKTMEVLNSSNAIPK